MVILRKKLAGISRRALEHFARRARRAAGLKGEVNVLVTGSAEIRRLNRRFRKKDEPTDVLSFPAADGISAGDIAISSEIGAVNARRLGLSPAEELKILILHGMLHLAGYDHERDQGAMARQEQRLRRALGLPSSLIERSRDGTPPTADGGVRARRRRRRT
ncbi:MAG TPA: rRNA maturation RNase YbeY [Terriglobales bacterium]|nr:rRNA maturation RNase YbeY [Terriglobales bacterium]